MQLIDAALFLPLSETTLHRVLDESLGWDQALEDLQLPELASLWLLSGLASLHRPGHASPERLLGRIFEALSLESTTTGLDSVRRQCLEQLDRARIESGYYRMSDFRIGLLDSDTCERQRYLRPDGQWNFAFTQQQRELLAPQRLSTTVGDRPCALSIEQSRVFREFRSESDEHIHIQGYAGTGKTSLIKALLSLFDGSSGHILVLAEFKRQLDALGLAQQHRTRIHACTFGELAEMVIPPDMTSAASRNMRRRSRSRATQPDDELIRRLGIQATGSHDCGQLITAVRATVYRYCLSGDELLDSRHIPLRHAARFQSPARAIVAEHARALWQAILAPPTSEFRPQIRDFHRIKWAALNGWTVPDSISHILVDECHDLPPPVYQILTNSPQARATLGDDYQNLRGRSAPRNSAIRQRDMVQSIRSGKALESIVNPIIRTHPSRTKALFNGNEEMKLDIRYYRKADLPEVPAVILASSTWGLFEWSQRLARAGIKPSLMGEPRDLDMFVQDCIELRNGHAVARHAELFRYRSWEHLARDQAANRGFQRIQHLLDRGYTHTDWKQTYQRLQRVGTPMYCLGMVEHVRNLEFDTVMLTPDVMDDRQKLSQAAFGSTIYVAVTRARRRLVVPEALRDWIEEISSTGR